MAHCTHCGVGLRDGARFCAECGTAISISPSIRSSYIPPVQSALSPTPQMKVGTSHRVLAAVFLIVAFGIVAVIIHYALKGPVAGSATASESSSSSESSSPVLPSTEARFVQVILEASANASQAQNDMQKGGIKARRDRELCNIMPSLSAQDWVGTLKTIDSNSDGKGVLAIEVAHDVVVQTWNNEFSDMFSHTLIQPGSAVFETASAMKSGQLVTFSGSLLRGSDGDCFQEGSLRLDDKIEAPKFIFRFASIGPYIPSQQSAPEPSTPKQAEQAPVDDVPPPSAEAVPDAEPSKSDASQPYTQSIPAPIERRSAPDTTPH
jgi:hypothetical protein